MHITGMGTAAILAGEKCVQFDRLVIRNHPRIRSFSFEFTAKQFRRSFSVSSFPGTGRGNRENVSRDSWKRGGECFGDNLR